MAPEPVEIEVVAYGPGIAFLKNDDVNTAEIHKLESSRVHFIACGNVMRKRHLEASDLITEARSSPSASLRL